MHISTGAPPTSSTSIATTTPPSRTRPNVSARAQQKLYRTADCLGGEAESNERWQIKMHRRVKNKSFSVLFSQGQPFGNQCINARLLDGKLTSHGLCSPILQNSLTWGQAEENHHHQTCMSTHIRLHFLRLEKTKNIGNINNYLHVIYATDGMVAARVRGQLHNVSQANHNQSHKPIITSHIILVI